MASVRHKHRRYEVIWGDMVIQGLLYATAYVLKPFPRSSAERSKLSAFNLVYISAAAFDRFLAASSRIGSSVSTFDWLSP